MATLPDAALLAAACEGDDVAWHRLHTTWAPVVLGWCVYLGGGRIDADEAARDVFFRLWRTIQRIDPPAAFKSYLYGMTRRVVSEHRRKAWVRKWTGSAVPDRPDPHAGPERDTAARRLALQAQEALDSLRASDREILVACDVLGHTTAEAADLLDLSPNTAKSRLSRARGRFDAAARRRGLTAKDVVHA